MARSEVEYVTPQKLVIVGGGFGGIKLARLLAAHKQFDITLISDRSHFEFHTALCRAATGRSPLEVRIPLDQILASEPSVKLARDTITAINTKEHTVTGASKRKYSYDRLVLALGVVSIYSKKPRLDNLYDIRSLAEADRLKHHLHANLDKKPRTNLRYVIVGAGPTGVELAGELITYLGDIYKAHGIENKPKVQLYEAKTRILPNLPMDYAARMSDRLKNKNVEVYTGTKIDPHDHQWLDPDSNEVAIPQAIIWTAGQKANPLFENNPLFVLNHQNRVVVGPDLSVAPRIYVIGDSAATRFSGWAQTAIYDADFLAHNWVAEVEGGKPRLYTPSQPIAAIPIQLGWSGIAADSARLYGYAGWLRRRWLERWLLGTILPTGLANKTWLYGTRRAETCSTCAKYFKI